MRAGAGEGGGTRDYVRGSVRLEVLRGCVPCMKLAVEAALSRQFAQLTEYTLAANERALESVPRRLGAELLCWGRRCDQSVAVPAAWLVASGARFVAGNAHRREVLTAALGPLWAAQAELATLERELAPHSDSAAQADAPERATPLWVVDFRRMRGPTAAMCGAIPVCSLDGQTLDDIPEPHALLMRERSPRLADALRMGFANHEHWKARAEQPESVEAASVAEGAVYREQCAAFVRTPGAVACKSCVYLLDTWVPDGACAHRPGAMASQVYVGLVGSIVGDKLVNTVGKRMLQHLAGDELLVDMEMQNPELRRCDYAEPGRNGGPQPAMLLLPLDFGTPGLHGKHSVGHLEGVYMRYFDCVSPLGLNATRSRGERAYSQAAWALLVQLNEAHLAACVAAGSACALLPPAAPPLPAGLAEGLRVGRAEARQQLLDFVTQHGDLALHGALSGIAGVPFQALLDRAIELNVVCMDAYKTTVKQRALYGANAETLLKAQRTGCGAALNTDLIHDSTGENGNYAYWNRATHESWSLTRLLYPRNPNKVTDAELLAAMAEAKAAREEREAGKNGSREDDAPDGKRRRRKRNAADE